MTIIEDAVACDVASHNHTFHLTASQQIRAIEPVEKVPRTDFEGFLIKLGDKKWRIKLNLATLRYVKCAISQAIWGKVTFPTDSL